MDILWSDMFRIGKGIALHGREIVCIIATLVTTIMTCDHDLNDCICRLSTEYDLTITTDLIAAQHMSFLLQASCNLTSTFFAPALPVC